MKHVLLFFLLLISSVTLQGDEVGSASVSTDDQTSGAYEDGVVPWCPSVLASSSGTALKPTGRVLSPAPAALDGVAPFFVQVRIMVTNALGKMVTNVVPSGVRPEGGDIGCHVFGPFAQIRYMGLFKTANDHNGTVPKKSVAVLVKFSDPQKPVEVSNIVFTVKAIAVPEVAFTKLSGAIGRQIKRAKYQVWMQAGTDGVSYYFHVRQWGYGPMFGHVWNPLPGFGGGITEVVDALMRTCEERGVSPSDRDVPLVDISHILEKLSDARVEMGPDPNAVPDGSAKSRSIGEQSTK